MPHLTVTAGEPLLAYLLAHLGLKRKAVKDLLKFGAVSVNGRVVRQFDHPLSAGDDLVVTNVQAAVAANRLSHARIEIVYEDQSLIVLDKPAGLLTVATDWEKTDTLFVRLNEYLHSRDAAAPQRAHVVHRLDAETSGLVLFAKSQEVKSALQERWTDVQKLYWAIVEGRPDERQGTVSNYLVESRAMKVHSCHHAVQGAQLAITHFRELESNGEFSLVEVRLETGRKHQIRSHLAQLGCPVAGDKRYGAKTNPCGRLGLHAFSLTLSHPDSGQAASFHSPRPAAFRKLFA